MLSVVFIAVGISSMSGIKSQPVGLPPLFSTGLSDEGVLSGLLPSSVRDDDRTKRECSCIGVPMMPVLVNMYLSISQVPLRMGDAANAVRDS